MIKTTLTLFLMCLIAQVSNAQNTKINEKVAWKTYAVQNVKIQYPNNWELDTSKNFGTTFFLFSPITSPTDQFKENINLIIQDISKYNLTFEQYVEAAEAQIATIINDAKIISGETVKSNNQNCRKTIFTGKQGIYELKFETYCWIEKGKAYVLTFTCEKKEFDNYINLGDKIMSSFEIK